MGTETQHAISWILMSSGLIVMGIGWRILFPALKRGMKQ